jgi:MFS family permease
MTSRLIGLWRNPDFLKFWGGQTISVIGSSITGLALPLLAAVSLKASPEQMGILAALGQVAYLIVSLPAGAWIDRTRRRPIMIAADFGRALCIGAVPLLAVMGLLRIEMLYPIALIGGTLTVFFELAYVAYLPVLASREHIVEANAKLETSRSAAQIAGPGLAGLLIQWIGAPLTMVVDALSYLISGLTLLLIRQQEADPAPAHERPSMLADITEGIRVVSGNRLLRTLTIGIGLYNFTSGVYYAVVLLYLVNDLKLDAASIGLAFTISGPGTLLGALMARRISERLGLGWTIIASLVVGSLAGLLIPFAQPPAPLAIAMIATGYAIFGACLMIFNINVLSLRQSITSDRLLGRVAATQRFIVLGLMPLGSLLGGYLGGALGVRTTLFISDIGGFLPILFILFSPVIHLHNSTQAVEQYRIE